MSCSNVLFQLCNKNSVHNYVGVYSTILFLASETIRKALDAFIFSLSHCTSSCKSYLGMEILSQEFTIFMKWNSGQIPIDLLFLPLCVGGSHSSPRNFLGIYSWTIMESIGHSFVTWCITLMSGDTNVITSCTAAHACRQCADCARGCCLWFCTTCIDAKRADIQANTRWGMFRYALPCPAPTGYELYIHGSAIPCVYVCIAT